MKLDVEVMSINTHGIQCDWSQTNLDEPTSLNGFVQLSKNEQIQSHVPTSGSRGGMTVEKLELYEYNKIK